MVDKTTRSAIDLIDSIYDPNYVDARNVKQWIDLAIDGGSPPKPVMFVPPFPKTVIEYYYDYLDGRQEIRATVRSFDIEALDDYETVGFQDDTRWCVAYDLASGDIDFLFSLLCEYDEDGNRVEMFTDKDKVAWSEEWVEWGRGDEENWHAYAINLLYPCFMAISLMHCRNVELIDKPISRQYRRHLERQGKPVIQYKMLDIEPFKTQVRNETAESGENEIERALHICRGHFATYTEDAPLFGKHVGTFWKPMHVRGSADAGVVEKDYKVIADDS